MSRYSAAIEKHFLAPLHVGRIESPSGTGTGFNAACGDELRIFVRVDSSGRVEEVSFEARACSAVIATASIATDAILGSSLAEAHRFDVDAALDALGGLPRQRTHAKHVVARALSEALAEAAR